MVTVDTISEEQLRGLLKDESLYVRHTASTALYCNDERERRRCRKQCADVLNERAAYKPPTTREEAIAEVLRMGATIPALLAVAEAFPLPGEREVTDEWLRKLAAVDVQWHVHLMSERERYLVAWGKV